MVKIKKKKEEEIYEFVINRFTSFKNKRDEYDERVYDWIRLFNSIPRDDKEPWENNFFVPYIFATVKTITPRIVASLFNDPYFLDVRATNKAYIQHEKNIRDWYYLKLKNMDFRKKMRQAIQDALIYPASWFKVLLKKDDKGIVRVDLEKVDYLDIWTDFAYKEKITEIFHRIESNIGKLKILEQKGIYKNVDKLIDTSYPMDIPQKKADLEALYASIGEVEVVQEPKIKSLNRLYKVELLEWWGYYDINDDGIDEPIVVTIGNREVGMRIDLFNDDIPFFPIRTGKNTRIIYGKPLPQVLEMLQEELNENRSKRMDALDRAIKQMYKARRTARIDWDNLFSAPDNVILLDDIREDLDIIPATPIPRAVYEEEAMIKGDMNFTSGANDYAMLGGVGNRTATGISVITSESATRFRDIVDDIVEDTMPLLNYIFYKIKKYSTETESIRKTDSQEWVNITPESLKGNYDIEIGIANINTPNKEVRLQLLINLLNIIGRMPNINVKEFIKRILDYADIRNIDAIIGDQQAEERAKVRGIREAVEEYKKDIKERKKYGGGMEGVVDRVVNNQLLQKPLAPQAKQILKNPFLDLVRSLGGNQIG